MLDAAKREGVAPRDYVETVLARHFHRQAVTLPAKEAELLQQINIGLPEEAWRCYHLLREKLEDESLTSEEQAELIGITDRLEAANVKRIEALIKLAEMRNTTLDALMDELDLRPARYPASTQTDRPDEWTTFFRIGEEVAKLPTVGEETMTQSVFSTRR